PRKNRALLIGGAIAAVIVVVVAIVAFSGGDSKKSSTLGGLGTAVSTTTSTVKSVESTSTVPQTTTEPTLVITTPSTTAPTATTLPSGGGTTIPADVQVVTDDSNSFKVGMPKVFNVTTKPLDTGGVKFAHVSGSKDLTSYVNNDDTFGISVLATTTDKVATPSDFLDLIKPNAGACSKKATETITTSFGKTLVNRYDGCGTGGKFSKVIMSTELGAQGAVLLVFAQGASPSTGDLFTFAKAVFETVTPL
ncbi:MAG: hypothetical protein WCI22_05650, partial [Actinomycetota bacterium]